jgi:hypothetical protein
MLVASCDPPKVSPHADPISRLRAEWNPVSDVTGKTIHLADELSRKYLVAGWSAADRGLAFRWSEGRMARISLPIRRNAGALLLKFTMGGLVNPPALPSQRVHVVVNGRALAEWQVSTRADFTVAVPAELTNGWTELQIELQLPDAASPRELGHSADARQLGIYLFAISVARGS